MSKGRNIFLETINDSYTENKHYNSEKPVVFLSHKSEDKNFVEEIGQYLMDSGINIYLDKNDEDLRTASTEGNALKVTECIHKGISNSDYILCITSKQTINSWWVPYEIGYGKKANKTIATLVKKDVAYIPDFLKIETVIKDIEEMNIFIKKIAKNNLIKLNENHLIDKGSSAQIQYATPFHPLASYLNY